MTISINMKRIQNTKDLGLMEVELEIKDKQVVYIDLSTKSKLKDKSRFNTENLREKIVDKENFLKHIKN